MKRAEGFLIPRPFFYAWLLIVVFIRDDAIPLQSSRSRSKADRRLWVIGETQSYPESSRSSGCFRRYSGLRHSPKATIRERQVLAVSCTRGPRLPTRLIAGEHSLPQSKWPSNSLRVLTRPREADGLPASASVQRLVSARASTQAWTQLLVSARASTQASTQLLVSTLA